MLRRTEQGKMLGGVCAGMQKHNGIPVAVTRLGFLLAMIPLAVVVPPLIYLGLWLFVPDEDGKSAFGGTPDSTKASVDLEAELKRIQGLKDQNLISEEDYVSLRAKAMKVHVEDDKAPEQDAVSTELTRLHKMHEDGIIDADELSKLRKKALGIA